jgi:arginine/lysine/histidine/glutamine transport system substrate-binding/permease protein
MSDFISIIVAALPNLLLGAVVTLQLTALSTFFGLILGTLVALARLSPAGPLKLIARIYVDFIRGTPLLVQIFLIYFGVPSLLQGIGLEFRYPGKFTPAVLALSINAAAYISEIMRGGIQSIELGQQEASQSLGLGSTQTMWYVILPQAFRRMIPPLGNEFITLLKDTSLVAVIGLEELFRRGQLIYANNYAIFQILTAVALVYLVLTLLSSQVFSFLEWWMDPIKRKASRSASTNLATE